MNDLIDQLASDLEPVRPGAARRRLGLAVIAGAALSMIGLMLLLGLRADIAAAVMEPGFWMKLAFTLGLAALLFPLACRLAAPGRGSGAWLAPAAALVLVLVSAGATQLITAEPAAREALWLGGSWRRCLAYVSLLSLPVFATTLFAMRRLAPTRLRSAGLTAGLLSGAVGAGVYALSCQEHSAAFLATWYLAGIGVVGLVGWLAGPKLLRW
jgi:hypothetical protein